MDTYRVSSTDEGKVRVQFNRVNPDGSTPIVTIELETATAREVGSAMVAVADHLDKED